MTPNLDPTPEPKARWRLWLGRFLLIPLIAMWGGLLIVLGRALESGEITTVSRRGSSRTYAFEDSPVLFSIFFGLPALLAIGLIVVTVVVARLSFPKTRGP